jgi:hypothetical protein
MINVQNIRTFTSQLSGRDKGSEYVLSFETPRHFRPDGAPSLRFRIMDGRIFYDPTLKLFPAAILRYVSGNLELRLERGRAMVVENLLVLDFKRFLSACVEALSDVEMERLFADISGLSIVKRLFIEEDEDFLTNHHVDNVALCYYQYAPKRIESFLDDFPSIEKPQFYRLLLRLSLLGRLDLLPAVESQRSAESTSRMESGEAMILPLEQPVGRTKTPVRQAAASRRAAGLQRILHTIKNI